MRLRKQSFWDCSVVRKYSSLSHYRVLSQLATELKTYPMNRKHNHSKGKTIGSTTNQSLLKDDNHNNKNIYQDELTTKNNIYNNMKKKDI